LNEEFINPYYQYEPEIKLKLIFPSDIKAKCVPYALNAFDMPHTHASLKCQVQWWLQISVRI